MASQSIGKSPAPGAPASAASKKVSTPVLDAGLDSTARAPTDRKSQIAVAAYYKAEHRGFAPGQEIEDWLAAEQEVDAHEANRSGAPVEARY